MLRALKNIHGFASIIEVVVTSIIFILSVFAILTTVSSLRPQSNSSTHQLEAIYVGREYMDYLRRFVNAQSWNSVSSPLITGHVYTNTIDVTKADTGSQKLIGRYNISYVLRNDPAGSSARLMLMNVTYSDLYQP